MVRSDTTLPGCDHMDFFDAAPEDAVRFYEFLFSLGQDYGMTMYEPDVRGGCATTTQADTRRESHPAPFSVLLTVP